MDKCQICGSELVDQKCPICDTEDTSSDTEKEKTPSDEGTPQE